eukprot:SAG22_NODE_2046_length_3086_cov_3.806495_4_plen_39_part_01
MAANLSEVHEAKTMSVLEPRDPISTSVSQLKHKRGTTLE